MSESLNLLDEVYGRQTCVINVLYTAGEIYIFNESIIIQNRSSSYNLQDHYTSECFKSEQTYNLEIRIAQPSYLGEANNFIQEIETKAYCDILHGGNGS